MHRGWGWLVAGLIAAAMLAAPAKAADEGRRVTGPQVAKLLQDMGYRATVGVDGEGDPKVDTAMGGVNVSVYFYDCVDGACGSLQLSIGLDLDDGTTHAVINAFNRRKRYSHAYLDDENDPFLAYDFEVLHTDFDAHVRSQVDLWESLLADFLVATGYRQVQAPPAASATSAGAAGRRSLQ